MTNEILTISEAARRIGVSVTTLRKWADNDVIEVKRLPGSGYRRFDSDVVDAFIESMKENNLGKGLAAA